ncbi:MAG TPA: long-chain fatty acid--CoA ligase [bacterium]|nr:long-chain fatty acid--CoA ligase [bacterium]
MNQPRNVVEMFLAQCRAGADRSALLAKREGKWQGISWREWEAEVRRLAHGLIALGLKPEETATLASNNRPEWIHLDLAVQMVGGVLVTIYPTLAADDVRFIINDAQARFAVVENLTQLQKLPKDPVALPKLEKIILIDGVSDDPRVVTYAQLRQLGNQSNDAELADRYENIAPGDIATIVYTSGTTGRPKGAMLTQDNFMFISETMLRTFGIHEQDIYLSYLPLSHVYERFGAFYPAIRAGVKIYFAESLEKLSANLQEVHPTIFCAVPRVLEKVYAAIQEKTNASSPTAKKIFNWALAVGRQTAPYRQAGKALPNGLALKHRLAKLLVYDKISARLGGSVRLLAVAGAPMSKEIAEFFFALNVLILEAYGMTESSAPSTMNTFTKYRMGTVGTPLPGVEVRLATDGEVLMRGRSIFAGYFNKPAESAEMLAGGWLHTGDIGEFDDDGMLRITDRKKDLIVTAYGKNVAPQKIENMLIVDPYIAQAVVIGDRRSFLTALISPAMETIAQYAKEKGFNLPERAKVAECEPLVQLIRERVKLINDQLARYETIKDFRLLDHDLSLETGELTPTLKAKRKVINQHFRELIDSMYADKAGMKPASGSGESAGAF